MKRYLMFVWAVALVLTAGCSSPKVQTDDPRNLAETTMAGTVKVTLADGGHGSGFAVSEDTIVTAAHVASDALGVFMGEIKTTDGQTCAPIGLRMAIDDQTGEPYDAAMIKVRGCILHPLQTRRSAVRRGEAIYLAGHPYGWGNVWTSGAVATFEDHEITVDAAALPGMSGGPAVDSRGRVVGIIVRIVVARGGGRTPRVWGGLTHLTPIKDAGL